MAIYKLHDITSDCYYPSSKEIFIPNVIVMIGAAVRICDDNPDRFLKEALEVLTYDDNAFFEEPKEIEFLSDFVIKL